MILRQSDIQTHDMLSAAVALEAFSLGSLTQAIKRVFSNAVAFFSEGNKKLLAVEHDLPPETSKVVKACLKTFDKFNYIASVDVLVSTPEGFQGNLNDYSDLILTNNPILIKSTITMLEEFAVYVANASIVGARKPNKELENKASRLLEEQLELTLPYRKDSTMSVSKVSDLYRSKVEVLRVLESSAKHTGYLYKTKLTPIKLAVDKATAGINSFLSQTGDLDAKFSREAILSLTHTAELLAKLVDLTAKRYFEQKLLVGTIDEHAVALTAKE